MNLTNNTKLFYMFVFMIFISLPLIAIIGVGLLLPQKPTLKNNNDYQFITVLNSKIRYRIKTKHSSINNLDNQKSALILLQGFTDHEKQRKKIELDFSPDTVIWLDTIGFGGSDAPDVIYTLDTQRKYIIAFMDALKLKKAILAGGSKGASITAWTAANSPERINSIILIAPSAYPGSMSKKWPYNLLYSPGIINYLASKIVHTSIYKILFPNNMGPQLIDLTSTYNSDFANALDKITQPTLLLWSKGDKTSLYKYSNEYRSRIKNITFIQMPDNLGHNVFHRAPEKTTALINAFIENTKS